MGRKIWGVYKKSENKPALWLEIAEKLQSTPGRLPVAKYHRTSQSHYLADKLRCNLVPCFVMPCSIKVTALRTKHKRIIVKRLYCWSIVVSSLTRLWHAPCNSLHRIQDLIQTFLRFSNFFTLDNARTDAITVNINPQNATNSPSPILLSYVICTTSTVCWRGLFFACRKIRSSALRFVGFVPVLRTPSMNASGPVP